jgi:hypothetical protein
VDDSIFIYYLKISPRDSEISGEGGELEIAVDV